jgi:uncharacterized protein
MLSSKKTEIPIEIDPTSLSSQALNGIIENFILREGTDYGANEVSYEKKAEQIGRQILKGTVKIVYDQTTETVSLLKEQDYRQLVNRSFA